MDKLIIRLLLLITIATGLPQAGFAAQTASQDANQASSYATNRYSPAPIKTSRNWFHKQQANYAATPGFDPQRPGYSDKGTAQQPGRNPSYDRKYDHEARLRDLATDPKVGSADRGWINQEIRRVDMNRSLPKQQRSGSDTLRNPPGIELAHAPGQENHKGYGFHYAKIQNADLHRLQHTGAFDRTWQYEHDLNNPEVGGDQWGRRNKERVPPEYQTLPDHTMNSVAKIAN